MAFEQILGQLYAMPWCHISLARISWWFYVWKTHCLSTSLPPQPSPILPCCTEMSSFFKCGGWLPTAICYIDFFYPIYWDETRWWWWWWLISKSMVTIINFNLISMRLRLCICRCGFFPKKFQLKSDLVRDGVDKIFNFNGLQSALSDAAKRI